MNRSSIVRMTAALLLAGSTVLAQAATGAANEDGRLQGALTASFKAAETESGATTSRRYVISRDTRDLASWASADKALRAAVFARRNTRGSLEIQSIAVLSGDARAHGLQDWKPAASLSLVKPDVSESDLFAAIRKIRAGAAKPEVLSYDRMLTRIRGFRGVVALISAPEAGPGTLAFIPDTVNISITGTAAAVSSVPAVSPVVGSGPLAQGEIVSSKPGETVRMIRDEKGNPAQLQFEVDPSQFGTASAPANTN